MQRRRVFVSAYNVHQGGGRALLRAIFCAMKKDYLPIFCIDERMCLPEGCPSHSVKVFRPNILQRLRAEWWIKKQVNSGDVVLCFGNLPPLWKPRGQVTVFLQNRYLVDDVSLSQFPWATRLRLMIERFWLKARMHNVGEFVVQTPSMKRLLEARTDKPVHVLPFMAQCEEYARKAARRNIRDEARFDFLYVASGEPHKSHQQLVEAWRLLAEQGMYPSLKLTLDEKEFPELCAWLREMVARHALKIENLGHLPHEQVLAIYKQAHALIYPSTFESFGLPLIEARQARLPILASELDYVRDVIDPEETFDPLSAISISRAVKRFMQLEEPPLQLMDAAGFLEKILG